MSRNIISGAVRLCYAVMYALFLGFGLTIGATVYEKSTGKGVIGPSDYSCQISHNASGSWWQRTPSVWWGKNQIVLLVFLYSLLTNFCSIPHCSDVLAVCQSAQSSPLEAKRIGENPLT